MLLQKILLHLSNINQLKPSKMENTKEQAKKLLLEFYNAIYSTKSEEERYRDARLCAIICQSHVANALIDDWKKYHKESDVFTYLIKNEPETIIN